MTLEAKLASDSHGFDLEVDLVVPDGHTTAIVGPNGAGKSTLLRVLAGLAPISRGSIELGGETWADAARRVWLPPDHRSVGVMFQDYLLFAHMSALENIAFGLRHRGRSKAAARALAAEWLERMGLADKADSRPRELSGGQAQRVALARALAPEPDMLLLDEPLSALDATTRAEVRRDLRKHLASFAGVRIVVTHDPLEAMYLADEIVVLEAGRITQSGSPADVTARPRSAYIARLVGTNLFRGELAGGLLRTDAGSDLSLVSELNGRVLAVVSPRGVALHRSRPGGSPRNSWPGTVESVDILGERARVTVAAPDPVVAEVTLDSVRELGLLEGEQVWIAIKATEIDAYPA